MPFFLMRALGRSYSQDGLVFAHCGAAVRALEAHHLPGRAKAFFVQVRGAKFLDAFSAEGVAARERRDLSAFVSGALAFADPGQADGAHFERAHPLGAAAACTGVLEPRRLVRRRRLGL